MINRLLARGRDDSGAVLIEFALVLPVMLALMIGSFEISELVRAQMKLSSAADAFAQLIAATSDVGLNSAAMAGYCSGAQLIMAPFDTSGFSAAATSVTNDLNKGITVDWQNLSCGTAAPIANPASLTPLVANNPGDTVILVQATYKYVSVLSYVLPANFTLSQVVYAHPRANEPIPYN